MERRKAGRARRRPALAEFYGLPGGGKSTLCDAVSSELVADGLSLIWRDESEEAIAREIASRGRAKDWALNALNVSRRWKRTGVLARHTLAFSPSLHPPSFNRLKLLLRRLHLLERWRPEDVDLALFDQGLVQLMWDVSYLRAPKRFSSEEQLMGAAVELLPDLLIHVHVPFEVAKARMLARRAEHGASGPIEAKVHTYDDAALRRTAQHSERIAEVVARLGVEVIQVDGTADLEESTATIVSGIEGFLSD